MALQGGQFIFSSRRPRTQFQGQLLCVSDLGLVKNIVERSPHMGWWWSSCQELKAVVETVNDEQLAEAALSPKKKGLEKE